LSDLEQGQFADFFAFLLQRSRGATRDGKPYYTCRFRDARRTVAFMAWEDSGWFEACERDWQQGHFYKIRGTYGDNERYGPQIAIHNIRAVNDADGNDGFDPADFVDHSRFSPEAMFAELKALAHEHIADKPLARLVLTILDRHAGPLQRLPATTRHYFPFRGGLLEHTLSVVHTCLHLAEKYATHYSELRPPLNRDLIVAGAILHDIGRILEFEERLPLPERTVSGRLVGHVLLGRDLVRDTGRELGDVNPELLRLLEHIIVAHLNLPERGSPRPPLMPECLIIHHADDLDAKLEMYIRCLSRDHEPGAFTSRDPVLGRELYKGRSV
jgi:3'-5' exoribonuclease